MARNLPTITFGLTRPFTPQYEAVSREIAALREGSRDSVVAVLPLRSNPFLLRKKKGVLTGHPLGLYLTPLLRAQVAKADILHVFAPLPLPRRVRMLLTSNSAPRLLTVIALDKERGASTLSTFDHVVVESAPDKQWLHESGFPRERCSLVYPFASGGITAAEPEQPFTVLFASWPFQRDESHSRGLDLVAEAATLRPGVRFLVLTRPGTAVNPRGFNFPPNVEIDTRVHADFEPLWSRVHAVIAPFRSGAKSKSVPNSLVEGIGAGRPAIVTRGTGIAPLIAEHGAGVVCDSDGFSLAQAIDEVAVHYDLLAARAHELARLYFGVDRFRTAYREIYARLGQE
jgi:glycosyltransferase involved in cell wall biosynthesis